MIPDGTTIPAGSDASPPRDDSVTEQELYAALRAAGVSPEEAQSCLATNEVQVAE